MPFTAVNILYKPFEICHTIGIYIMVCHNSYYCTVQFARTLQYQQSKISKRRIGGSICVNMFNCFIFFSNLMLKMRVWLKCNDENATCENQRMKIKIHDPALYVASTPSLDLLLNVEVHKLFVRLFRIECCNYRNVLLYFPTDISFKIFTNWRQSLYFVIIERYGNFRIVN